MMLIIVFAKVCRDKTFVYFCVVRHFRTKTLITLILFFVGNISNAQHTDTTSIVTAAEDKIFLNDLRLTLKPRGKFRLSDKPYVIPSKAFFEKIATKDTILKLTDIDFILKQLKQKESLTWSNTFIDSTIFIKSDNIDSIFHTYKVDSGWKVFYKNFGGDFYRMSFPYFSEDKQTCIIYVGHHCGGLCGEGGLRIYRRRNNNWTLIKVIGRWVS